MKDTNGTKCSKREEALIERFCILQIRLFVVGRKQKERGSSYTLCLLSDNWKVCVRRSMANKCKSRLNQNEQRLFRVLFCMNAEIPSIWFWRTSGYVCFLFQIKAVPYIQSSGWYGHLRKRLTFTTYHCVIGWCSTLLFHLDLTSSLRISYIATSVNLVDK